MNRTVLLTFDVEDWFQVENLKECIPFSSWQNCELRVEQNVNKILDLLDSIKLNNPTNASPEMRSLFHWDPINRQPLVLSSSLSVNTLCAMPSALCRSPKATFFVLGWIAERLPDLIRGIQARGHEVASHGYFHKLCKEESVKDLKNDLTQSKKLLEDVTGNPVYGYRAPGFSIDDDILKIIKDSGYVYDSSFNSFKLNRRYGQLKGRTDNGSNGVLFEISDRFYELPVSNLRIRKQVLPWGGGGYFRLIPARIFKLGIRTIMKQHGAYLFYLHPWELDSEQPRVSGVPGSFKFRHYVNLDKTYGKLSMLLESLKEYRFSTCIRYITNETQQTQKNSMNPSNPLTY